jgi:hypothetical protein
VGHLKHQLITFFRSQKDALILY